MPPGRRWRVTRGDHHVECHVQPVRDADGDAYEVSARWDGHSMYARIFPTLLSAEREADDSLRDMLVSGWLLDSVAQ